jgi:hypothetical protein
MLDLESGKIKDFIKFDIGNLAMVTGGHNCGRVGTIVHKEKHKGGHDIVHVEDGTGKRWVAWGIGRGGVCLCGQCEGEGGAGMKGTGWRDAAHCGVGRKGKCAKEGAVRLDHPLHMGWGVGSFDACNACISRSSAQHVLHTSCTQRRQPAHQPWPASCIVTHHHSQELPGPHAEVPAYCACCRFATRQDNVFVIGKGNRPMVSLPKGQGVRATILEEQQKRYASA